MAETGFESARRRRLRLAHTLQFCFRAGPLPWPEMLDGEQKWGAIGCSEVFVLPSHQENFGIVVAEALACRVPVLISNKINISREVQSEAAGFVETDTLAGTEALLQQWIGLSPQERKAASSA